MKCIYCGQELESDHYQGDEGWGFNIEVRDIECNVLIHRVCLAKVVGEYVTEKVCGPRQLAVDPAFLPPVEVQALREMEE